MPKRNLTRNTALCFALLGLSGCMTIAPLEPVKEPPVQYKKDVIVPVELVHPAKVGFRCAERGAKFLMLPGINSQACSNTALLTMPNPCHVFTGGAYSELFCSQLAKANGWKEDGTSHFDAPMLNYASESQSAGNSEPEAKLLRTRYDAPEDGADGPALEFVSAKPSESAADNKKDDIWAEPDAVLQPVKRSVSSFRHDTTVPIEFVRPEKIAFRCVERGAKISTAGDGKLQGCATVDLVTLPNPCFVKTFGWYNNLLCHEMAHANGWPPNHKGGNWLPDRFIDGTPTREVPPVISASIEALPEKSSGDQKATRVIPRASDDAPMADIRKISTPALPETDADIPASQLVRAVMNEIGNKPVQSQSETKSKAVALVTAADLPLR